ncbi:MAG: PAS domain S-box protein, partial [Planctomycetes bacterium]|nr:PAS domain S-box protein [Planctomycetota bacterium]
GIFAIFAIIYRSKSKQLRAERYAALAVKESEVRLRQVVENMPVMLDAFDTNGNIIVWNKECERVTGHRAQEIINNPQAMALLHPDEVYCKRIMTAWAERGGDYHDWEWQITCKDGTVKTVAWSNISRRLPIPGWANWSIGVDVTKRKQVEQSLRESKAFTETILNTSPDVIYIYDLVEQVNVYSNEGIMQVLGYSTAEIQEMGENVVQSFMHPHDFFIYVNETLPRYQSTPDNELIEHEYRMKHKNGEWYWLHAKELVFLRQDDGTAKQIFGLISDITKRKRAEKQIRASLREKETLLQEIHHRVKNNLAIVSSLLNFQAKTTQDEQIRTAFQESQNRIQAMANIHEHLYRSPDLARIDMAQYV